MSNEQNDVNAAFAEIRRAVSAGDQIAKAHAIRIEQMSAKTSMLNTQAVAASQTIARLEADNTKLKRELNLIITGCPDDDEDGQREEVPLTAGTYPPSVGDVLSDGINRMEFAGHSSPTFAQKSFMCFRDQDVILHYTRENVKDFVYVSRADGGPITTTREKVTR